MKKLVIAITAGLLSISAMSVFAANPHCTWKKNIFETTYIKKYSNLDVAWTDHHTTMTFINAPRTVVVKHDKFKHMTTDGAKSFLFDSMARIFRGAQSNSETTCTWTESKDSITIYPPSFKRS